MPKTKFQDFIFTIIMVIVMVYAMICYNIAIEMGGMSNSIFLYALEELLIMGPIGFVFDFFIVGHLAKKITFKKFNPQKDNVFFIVLSISAVSVMFMCPLMSLMATILFKDAGVQFVAVWFQTTIINFPMALCWQIFFAGPLVRFIFKLIFKKQLSKDSAKEKIQAQEKIQDKATSKDDSQQKVA